MNSALLIRPAAEDDIAALTALLHRAYRPLAQRGMRYLASHQDEDVTRRRLSRGRGHVALWNEALAGTITFYPTSSFDECAWYQRPEVWYFGQYAVDPVYQGRGIGGALLEFAEQSARDGGASELALDTSEHAAELIALYTRRGYRLVETLQWPVTNYRSLVLSKSLIRRKTL